MKKSILTIACISLVFAAVALAQEGEKKPAKKLSKAEKAELNRAELKKRKPVMRQLAPMRKNELTASGRLVQGSDGLLLLAKSVDQKQRKHLLKFGYRKAKNADDIGHRTIFEGQVFYEYAVAAGGPDEAALAKRVGKDVVLQIRQDARGHPLVVGFAK